MNKFYILTVISVLSCCRLSFGQSKQKFKEMPVLKITGGSSTSIDQQPWQVRLSVSCGGVIIGPSTILTAAHCVNTLYPREVEVYAGITFESQQLNGQVRSVAQIIRHPAFHSSHANADLAILQLTTPLNFNSNVQPIRYDGGTTLETPGTTALISGWGVLSEGGVAPDQLQRASVPIVDLNSLTQSQYVYPLTNNMIPAGGTVSICTGDSGGPL